MKYLLYRSFGNLEKDVKKHELVAVEYGKDIDDVADALIKAAADDLAGSEAAPTIKKKNLYILISLISLCLPCVILGSIALYCLITKNSVQLNKWLVIFLTAVPIIIWLVFDIKFKKLK